METAVRDGGRERRRHRGMEGGGLRRQGWRDSSSESGGRDQRRGWRERAVASLAWNEWERGGWKFDLS